MRTPFLASHFKFDFPPNTAMSLPKLYYNIICPPCRAVCLLARILKVSLVYEEVDILTKNYMKKLEKINLRHTIPVLIDHGFILADSHAIAPYLVQKYSNNKTMYPVDTSKRAAVDQLLHYDSGVLYPLLLKAITPILFRNQYGLTVPTMSRIENNYAYMDKLIKDKRWFVGDDLTIADLSCLTTTTTLDMLYPVTKPRFRYLSAYLERCENLPHYKECNLNGLVKLAQIIQDKMVLYHSKQKPRSSTKNKTSAKP